MEYKIVYAKAEYIHSAIEKLEEDVKKHIKVGWKPLGGVSIVKPYGTLTDHEVFQAMTKE